MPASTLLEKLWEAHRVAVLAPGVDLLHVDRHILIDMHSAAYERLAAQKLGVRNPEMNFSVPDHVVSSEPGRTGGKAEWSAVHIERMRRGSREHGIRLFDVNDPGQGIAHVIGPDLGITQPGMTLLVGDSHTCTHGALGALAWGIGASEVLHVLATQTIVQRKPKTLRVSFNGRPGLGVEPKDLILAAIGRIGTAGGTGHAVEYTGEAVRAMAVEGRMTICNLSVEMGSKMGMIGADERTFDYLRGRPYAPGEQYWDSAVASWKQFVTDDDAVFDREVEIDASDIAPQVTWGTSPQDVIPVNGRIPDPAAQSDPERRRVMSAALDYMGLKPGDAIAGTPIDWVFIGSCTNSRLPDLRSAAAIARGRKVAKGVRAWVVPGSQGVKRDAEAEGLDRVFLEAGFEWREPGCSLCVGANGEQLARGERSVSTSNRNFVGRQGPGARTHLASPAMAAAAAITGTITDVRKLAP